VEHGPQVGRSAITLRDAIVALHRSKDAAYGNAWKRRGEQMSILANIARKVDRLEHMITTGGTATPDESGLDTGVDLYVYCLKYLTYLADHSNDVADWLFGSPTGLNPPYSDGTAAFEALAHGGRFDPAASAPSPSPAADEVLRRFASLEQLLTPPTRRPTARERALHAADLAAAASVLVYALADSAPAALSQLLHRYTPLTDDEASAGA
jgi:hypothetical protein